MESTAKHSTEQKKRRIWPWVTLCVLLLMVLLLRLSLRSAPVLGFVKSQIETAANNQLNGTLTIESIRGDLWNHLLITGIRLQGDPGPDEAGTPGPDILRTDTLQIRYSLGALFRKTLKIDEIRLVNPVISLKEHADSTWNVERLIPPAEKTDEEPGELPVRLEFDLIDLKNGLITVESARLLPDTTLRLDEIDLQLSGMFHGDSYEAQLSHLSMQIHEGRLEDPIRFETGFSADENTLTLDKLVIATGRTLIEGSGSSTTDGDDITVDMESLPVSWRDIRAFAKEAPIAEDIRFGLHVSGNLDMLRVGLTASATGLAQFALHADLVLKERQALTGAELLIESFDGPLLTGEPDSPSLERLHLTVIGDLPFAAYEQSSLEFGTEITGIRINTWTIDKTEVRGRLAGGLVHATAAIRTDGQTVTSEISLAEIFGEAPGWDVNIVFESIDPGYWAADEGLAGDLSGTISMNGTGFEPSDVPWNFEVRLPEVTITGYEIRSFMLDGTIDRNTVISRMGMDIADGTISLNSEYGWADDNPGYNLDLTVASIDLSLLPGLEEHTSDINLGLSGSGRGIDPETLTLEASLEFQPSIISGIRIQTLEAPVTVSGGFIHIDRAELKTSLADGSLFARQHVSDFVHPQNLIEFDLELKDTGLLTNFIDAEFILAKGGVTGTYRHVDNLPQINAELSLSDVRFDTLSADAISGSINAVIGDSIPYSLDLLIKQPAYGETSLQNITFATDGILVAETVTGSIRLELLTDNRSGLTTAGDYYASADSVLLDIGTLSLSDPDRRLDLQKPFRVSYVNELVRMDSLQLESDDGASLLFFFEQYGEKEFRSQFRGRDVNLGYLQSSILGEQIFAGIYDGNLELNINNDELYVHVDALISGFEFNGLSLDTISVNVDIDDERLDALLRITDASGELITGHLSTPFLPGDPITFDDAFFEEPVSGSFRLIDTPLSRFPDFLAYNNLEELSGTIGVFAELTGQAGLPVFVGSAYLYESRISNVEIDSSLITWQYNHEEGNLGFSGFVKSLGQRAAEIAGTIPFKLDLKQFTVLEPDEDDEINVRMETDAFNIAAFNEFLDPASLRNLRGRLNSEIDIRGTIVDPVVSADVSLNNGAVMLVDNNVALTDIRTDMSFRTGMLTINRLSAESAGSFDLTGTIAFNGFEPGEMDLRANARNFRVYNTRDLNALITTSTRLTGDVYSPKLSGDLKIERGHLYLDNFGERTIEDVVLEDEEEESDLFAEIFDAMTIEYTLEMDRRFWVRNRSRPEIAMELQGNLDVVKYPGEDIQLFGTMGTSQGYAQQLGKRFDLERGDIRFSGQADNPELDIRTIYQLRKPEEIKIWYEIGGTVENPEFTYSSEPLMELQDIISYTLFGRPFHALQGWERTVAGGTGEGTSAADIAMDILLDRVETLAADRLGIDVIEIDNTRQGGSSGMTIKAGKYMTDRLFLAILQELGGGANSQFIIEYLLRTNLELIFTGSNDFRTGVDVLWKLDY
ncbi:MAG: translocation/assembly module TamB [Balneolaceae bacterium]|nr:MAG: translocation/assembly module TamB [Balneolaceae bacterium]